MEFNKSNQIKKMQPYVDKLVVYLKNKNIQFEPLEGKLENIILTSSNKSIKISHHSFYRYSGIACFCKEGKEKNSSETVEISDEMFYENIMKSIIKHHFEIN